MQIKIVFFNRNRKITIFTIQNKIETLLHNVLIY